MKYKQKGIGSDIQALILISSFTVRPEKKRKPHTLFLKVFHGYRSNFKLLEVIISYIFKQSPNLKTRPIIADRQLRLA